MLNKFRQVMSKSDMPAKGSRRPTANCSQTKPHKYFQLKGSDVAELLEMLLNVTSKITHSKTVTGPSDPRLRQAFVTTIWQANSVLPCLTH